MSSRFIGSRFQAITAAGVVPGALVYTMAAGTSFPGGALATYTATGAANENPVECDANGQAVIVLGAAAYRITVKTAAGVTLTDDDNILYDGGFLQLGTGATSRTVASKLQDNINVKDFGALSTNSAGTNKTCLQLAITALSAAGGVITIPRDTPYGYIVSDKTTWPSFAGILSPITIYDYSPGNSYAGYPTAYDGSQVRIFSFTPQTTVLGTHDGNTHWLRGAWAPNYCVSNDMDLSGARLATDNRRAYFTTFVNGMAATAIGQGSQSGSGFTEEQLTNPIWQSYPLPADTIQTVWAMALGDREHHRMCYGIGTNAPIAAHDFGPANAAETLPTMMVRTTVATADLHIQSTSGAANRTYIKNVSGETQIGNTAAGGGTAIKIKNDSTFLEFGSASAYTYHFSFQNSRASNFVSFVNNTSATDGFVQKLQSTATQAATWSFLEGYANAGADKRIVIAGTGNVTNTNNSYGAISDAKLKQDTVDAGSSWADFKAYQFRKYRFKSDPTGPLQLGVVAQEIEKVSPGLVTDTPDRDEDGNLTGTHTKEVAYSVLYLKACVVIQELMTRVEALEKR